MRQPMTFQQYLAYRKGWPVDCFFEPEELLFSETALAKGLDNLPTTEEWERLKVFLKSLLKPVRILWGAPLLVNSCFRDPEVNELDGGTDTSDHLFQIGGAADLRPLSGTDAAARDLFHRVAENALDAKREPSFDQLILYPERVHVGWRPTGNRKELRRAIKVRKPDGSFEWSWPLVDWEEWKRT